MEDEQRQGYSPKRSRKWLYIGIAIAVVAVLIVIIVPAAVVTTNKKRQYQSDPSSSSSSSPPYAKAQSKYSNLTRVKQLNELANKSRIFVLGDVHGCVNELAAMVDLLKYDQDNDAMILAGDLTSKGYDNPGVIRLAKAKNMYCVRGNHDDYVVRFKTFENENGAQRMGPPKAVLPEGNVADPLKFKDEHADIARNLTAEDYDYLVQCPMIIDLPFLNARVVHGGLDPEVTNYVDNDPYTVFSIRDIKDGVPTSDNKKGEHWTQSYNNVQKNNTPPVKVYYGHDASRGLDLENVTFGLDSGCVYGGHLTAIDIWTNNYTQLKCNSFASLPNSSLIK
ncbi:Metallo-dependent phosphatase-like protein [Halteromyces radiatus]|uniref:Metallo-dependent phosphatase-like protein n=1 Tax=Halteromyces radiatus TaxID=101107 RepID=UPI00221FA387|nr:Metallo-dependent phosphatase-like protein [Halteromyces radiatus]KAI8099554.1 Metallo-dependent phosphatase-like protein [Halteromyces radiatus]